MSPPRVERRRYYCRIEQHQDSAGRLGNLRGKASEDIVIGGLKEWRCAAAPLLARVHPGRQLSARNLIHYLALRRHDIRPLQVGLAELGFELTDDSLIVDLDAPAAPGGSEDQLSRAIVEATVDEVAYADASVRLVKRLPDSPIDLDA